MARTMTADLNAYRLPLWGEPDPRWRRCLQIAAALGIVTLGIVFLTPRRAVEITDVDEVPERFAKLILEEPASPAAPALPKAPEIVMEKPPAPVAAPKPIAKIPETVGQRRQTRPAVPEKRGEVGREKAKEATKQLASVSSSLDDVLADVSKSLASTDDGTPKKSRSSRRRPRSGRAASQLATMSGPLPTADASAESSRLEGTGIAIEAIESIADGGGPGGGGESAPGRSEARSDQQLLAVVRKYAPGIQFCYDNELKKRPGLGGKLLVSITVAAAGNVTDATIVTDTVRSAGLASCALAQIEAWRFPTIPEGVVTFQAPFVFTPPE